MNNEIEETKEIDEEFEKRKNTLLFTLLSVDIIPTSVYPEGQKGAAKRAESPEVCLVLHWEQFSAAGIASNRLG